MLLQRRRLEHEGMQQRKDTQPRTDVHYVTPQDNDNKNHNSN